MYCIIYTPCFLDIVIGHWEPNLKCISQNTATHHVISRKKLLQKLRLLVHNCLDDELIVLGDIED